MEGIGGRFIVQTLLSKKGGNRRIITAFFILSLFLSPLASALECPDGLVSSWDLNDQFTLGNDAVGSNDGTATGGIWSGSGRAGGALLLDGDDDLIDCGTDSSLDPGSALTVSAWVKPEKGSMLGARKAIVSKWQLDSDVTSDDAWDGVDITGFSGMGDYKAFFGGAFDGRYIYLVPYNAGGAHGKVARYDTTGALDADAAWEGIDITSFSGLEAYKGYMGAVFDGHYVYLVPHRSEGISGKVARFDTSGPFDSTDSWTGVDISTFTGMEGYGGFNGGVFDGKYVYFVPQDDASGKSGKVARYDTTYDFSWNGAWKGVDIATLTGTSGYKGFHNGVFDGRYIYFVPYYDDTYSGKMARYDTTGAFDADGSWSGVDISTFTDMSNYKGFRGAAFDGRYLYLVPYSTGSPHGNVARYDTTGAFDEDASWDGVKITSFTGMSDYVGFAGGAFDGRYLYLLPYFDPSATKDGRLARYDTTSDFTSDDAWDGINLTTLTGMSNYKGYFGGIFDGRYLYLVPYSLPENIHHGNVARFDTLTASSSGYRLTWSQIDQSGGFSGAPSGPGFEVVTDAGHFGAWADEDLSTGEWHHVAGVYTGSSVRIYMDGVLKGVTEGASGTVVASTAPLAIGGRAGSREQFHGAVDEVAVIDSGLNAGGVYGMYTRGLAGKSLCKEDLPEGYLPAITEGSLSCPGGMARIDAYWGSYCIDQYEAYNAGGGVAGSDKGKTPWTSITMADARTACEAAGKRLCTDVEWKTACNLDGQKYHLTAEENRFNEAYGCYTCNTDQNCAPWNGFEPVTGSHAQCRSDAGVFDMIGSVWEAAEATVPSDSWAGEDKVLVGDLLGGSSEKYGDDRVSRGSSGLKGNLLFRGGGWLAGADAGRRNGCSSLGLSTKSTYSASDFGFRCCSSPEDPPDITYVTIEDALTDQNQVFIDIFNEGLDHVREENYTGAITKFEECLEIVPTNANAINNLELLLKRDLPEGFELAVDRSTEPCGEGMARINAYWGSYCIDQFEAHDAGGGKAGSAVGKEPWNLKWGEAKAACEATGKHLCTDAEWKAACNLDGQKYDLREEENRKDETYGCNTYCGSDECVADNSAGIATTGSHPLCRSDAAVHDMIGNKGEWTDAQISIATPLTYEGGLLYIGEMLGETRQKYGDDALFPYYADGIREGDVFMRGGYSSTSTDHSYRFGCFYLYMYGAGGGNAKNGFRCCSGSAESPGVPDQLLDTLIDRNQVFIDTFNEALYLTREKKYDEAIAKFKECLRIDPFNENVLTNLGILDKRDLPEGTLLAVNRSIEPCAEGMARIDAYWGSYCIDKFEAHDAGSGKAGSAPGKAPWTMIDWNDAKAACTAAGKRLCTDAEWKAACNLDGKKYDLTEEESDETYGCNTYCSSEECTNDDPASNAATGSHPLCRSDRDVYDMIGNVMEYTDALVPGDTWSPQVSGPDGYVGEILGETKERYGDDYLWKSSSEKGDVFRRGSRWSTKIDNSPKFGCFSMIIVPGEGEGPHSGFRCCSGDAQSPGVPADLKDALIDRNQVFVDTFNAALDLARQGKNTDAIAKLKECLVIDPENANARTNILLLGGVVCTSGKTECTGTCVDLQTDDANCGACGTACTGGKTCQSGSCTCPSGKEDCSGTCVDTQTDPANCGTCANTCSEGQVCAEGICSADCPEGTTECTGACVDLQTDLDNCGTCGTECPSINAVAECAAGSCALKSCKDGYDDCDENIANGCEAPLNTDENCGICGTACTGGKACMAGSCVCPTGRTECYGTCVDLQSDVANCGVCGTACPEGQVCVEGKCSSDCPTGTTECTGSCVNLQADPANCGACGTACTATNANVTCLTGACAIASCSGGYGDCDESYATGCEVALTTSDNCGTCGKACTGGKACVDGDCACLENRTDCEGTCVDLNSNPKHCGACGMTCPEGQVCAEGACSTECPSGTIECTGACVNNATDMENCGSCDVVCTVSNGSPRCASGACIISSCAGGFVDCDEDYVTGCEAEISSDRNNCGACGTVCGEDEDCVERRCTRVITDATKLVNGETCGSGEECASGNCVNKVCCVAGESCCTSDADCTTDQTCDTERFFCIEREDVAADEAEKEKLKLEAEEQLAQARKLVSELKAKDFADLDTKSIDILISEAVKKSEAGDHAGALKVALDAVKAAEEEKDNVKLPIGGSCSENSECDTGNCQNKVCCKAGETCCDNDAHCKGEEMCDMARLYCVSKGERKQTIQERLMDMATDPEKLVTVIGAIVVGIGVGIQQLRSRGDEKKKEQEFAAMQQWQQQQQQQPQYYQGAGGQWQQYPQQGQQWGQQPGGGQWGPPGQ